MTKKSNKKPVKKPFIDIPENFKTILCDFTNDLSNTFPEYKEQLAKYSTIESITTETRALFEYFLIVFPERFFDILYQNEEIFKPESTINTCFLPNIDFKIFYNCQDITETTKKAIWKYLQLILFTIMNSVKDKSKFGETMNLFEGIDEGELQEKLGETMKDITDFFGNLSQEKGEGKKDGSPEFDAEKLKEQFSNMFGEGSPPDMEKIHEQFKTMFGEKAPDINNLKEEFKTMFDEEGQAPDMEKIHGIFENLFSKMNIPQEENPDEEKDDSPKTPFGEKMPFGEKTPFGGKMPDANNIHDHLKNLFDGKIGRLAKELAEEISGDLNDMFKKEGVEIKTTQDVLKHIMKNPKKIMELVKTIGTKLNSKMQSGEISQEEMMREASELIAQMKNMGGGAGGGDQFSDILKNLTKNMGGMGKNAKIDMNALNRLEKQMSMKDKLRKNLELKKQQQQFKIDPNVKIESTQTPNNYVFKVGDDKQEKSIKPQTQKESQEDIDEIMKKFDLKNEVVESKEIPLQTTNKKKKTKAKK